MPCADSAGLTHAPLRERHYPSCLIEVKRDERPPLPECAAARMRAVPLKAQWLGHRIQHTVRYTELAPDRFKNFWR